MDVRAALARRALWRGRRELRQLRPPRATLLRWLRVAPTGAVRFGRPGRGIDEQPASRVTLGRRVVVGDHVDIHLGPHGRIEIGDDVVIGPHVQIAADELVRIGAGAHVAAYGVLVDTWTYGREPTSRVPGPAPVIVGEGARLGLRVVVGPGTEIPAGTSVPTGALLSATDGARP